MSRQTGLLSCYVISVHFFASLSLSYLICKMGLILPPSHCLGRTDEKCERCSGTFFVSI